MNKYTHFYDEIEGQEYPIWDFDWNSVIFCGALVLFGVGLLVIL